MPGKNSASSISNFLSAKNLVFLLWIVAAFAVGYIVNYYNLFNMNDRLGLEKKVTSTSAETANSQTTVQDLTEIVAPHEGYTVKISWGDTGKKLVSAGGIDMQKYTQNYTSEKDKQLLTYLTETNLDTITINRENAYFWVNTLWALGLTDYSTVLADGVMGTEYKDKVGGFASTGGWTLGAKPGADLFASSEIIPLTAEQEAQIMRVAENVYRPCCGNSVAFPDCNHGMAILGLLSLMARDGYSDEEMYDASLAFNSYWFTSTYVDLAYYFQTKESTPWDKVDSKRALSVDFSSGTGYQNIKKQIGTIPGSQSGGASCGA
ncbi:MAG: hypothetical protein NUV98_01980 [Candidatus Roizmanbacteria bacterium]|nr:hypothetical protein [Candidatus Roizmanbacteria bacterium]